MFLAFPIFLLPVLSCYSVPTYYSIEYVKYEKIDILISDDNIMYLLSQNPHEFLNEHLDSFIHKVSKKRNYFI